MYEGGVGEGLGVCVGQHLGHTGPDGNARPPAPLSKSLMGSHTHTLSARHIHVDAHTSANKFINASKGIGKGEVHVLWHRPPPVFFFPSVAFHTSQLFTGLFVVRRWPGSGICRRVFARVCVRRNEYPFTHEQKRLSHPSHVFYHWKTIPYAPAAQS